MKTAATNNRGFTLIEIMVAVAIIGIMAGVVLVSMSSFGAKGRSAKALGEVSSAIPSMIGCWGNTYVVRAPASGGAICQDSGGSAIPSYGYWPNLSSLAGYSYNAGNVSSGSMSAFHFWVSGDSQFICCNSMMKSCGLVASAADCKDSATW